MTTHVAHPGALLVARAVRAHALVWLIAAVVLASAAAALIATTSGPTRSSATARGPLASPSSVTGNFVFPPAERTPSGKYLYP
jgi:hypothetical protein